MAERVRITNTSVHDVGLVTQSGIEYNIRPGAFITLTKDDAEYMVAMAPALFATEYRAGELRLDNEELAKDLNLVAPGEPSPADDVVVKKALSGTANQIKKYVEGVEDPMTIDAIVRMAHQMDLSQSKMKIIQEAFPHKFIY